MAISGFGMLLFFIFGGLAFWVLFYLLGFILPTWITLGVFEKIRTKRVFEDPNSDKDEE